MHIVLVENRSSASQIDEKVDEIRQALLEQTTQHKVGLHSGLSGIILLHSLEENKDVEIIDYLDKLFSQAEQPDSKMTFCDGLSGMGWMIELMSYHNNIIDDTNSILADLDIEVIRWMKAAILHSNYDYMHGAIGGALYLLKRIEKNGSEDLIAEIRSFTQTLISQAVSNGPKELYWMQKAGTVGAEENRINFGLSHGFPSILVYLCKVYEAGILKEELLLVINKVVHYLLNHTTNPIEQGNYFPTFLFPNNPEKNVYTSRLAWCYGDLGVCLSLWHANQIIRSKDIEQFIIKVLQLASKKRGLIDNNIQDAGFCHGSVGLGYIFHKFYQRYAIREFYDTAQYWLQKTYELDIHPDGPAGYLAYMPLATTNYTVEYGMLEGIAGIYSCIETIRGNLVADWDEMFLIS